VKRVLRPWVAKLAFRTFEELKYGYEGFHGRHQSSAKSHYPELLRLAAQSYTASSEVTRRTGLIKAIYATLLRDHEGSLIRKRTE